MFPTTSPSPTTNEHRNTGTSIMDTTPFHIECIFIRTFHLLNCFGAFDITIREITIIEAVIGPARQPEDYASPFSDKSSTTTGCIMELPSTKWGINRKENIMKHNLRKTICGAFLAVGVTVGGAMLPSAAMAVATVYDPYGRGEYTLEYAKANPGFKAQHQRKGYDDLGFGVWRYGRWEANGVRSWADVTGLHSANTFTAAFGRVS
ncbi:hypothetical protein BCAL_2141 [Bifidobacterium callitrichos DSM 23973]|nr:hypothetical protein BCAL_2141 [Bifidobacterium callitrichos DSM 23973]